jgi:hypothetical protein
MASVNSLAKPNAASAATIESWEQRETIEVSLEQFSAV